MGKNILQHLFSGYLKLLKKTVAIEWQEIQFVTGNQVFGFWHEDSFLMNLVLEELSGKTSPVDVIVTADTRGDYIKKILQDSYEQTRSIAVALDGPLGPRHEPKKLAFYLAEQAQESFVGISVSYHGCLRLFWRWDHYAIPLPFSKVIVAVHDYGEVNKKQIPDLPTRAEVSECGILLKGA